MENDDYLILLSLYVYLFIFTKPYETRVQTLYYSILQYFGTQLLRSRTN